MRSRLPGGDQRQFYRETQSRICEGKFASIHPSERQHLIANTHAQVCSKPLTNSYRVSHAQVQISRSSFCRARFATRSTSALSRMTAKTVEPEPDINAALTSACFSSHVFNCARKTNFSKTGRSRSFTKL